MELLKAVARFIICQIAILCLLIAAPALMIVVPFVLIAHGCGNDLGMLAFFYMAAGPFVSGVWTAFFMSLRRVLRMTTFGNRTAYDSFSFRAQAISCGWMLYGFCGTLVAEVAFLILFHGVSRSPVVFFAVAPLVVFAPLLLAWVMPKMIELSPCHFD